MNPETRWLTLVVVSSVAAVLATLAGTADGLSMIPLLWFLAVIPGLPFVRMLKNNDDPIAIGLTAVGLSLAIDALVAEALLYSHAYNAVVTVSVLAAVACLGAVIGRLRTSSGDPEPADPVGVRSEA